MGNPALTEQPEWTWPARFGELAERAPDHRALCRTVRRIPWRLRPRTVDDVREVLREAVRHGTPIWPVSRGCNWGYGSHLPARSGAVVVDLSSMDAIGELDRDSLSLRIEPGVTQGALADFLRLRAPDLALNVTGSGRETSVLGNALERGIGYSGEKDRDVFAIEALLADGTAVGPVPGRNHRSRSHPAGLSLDSLFFQSNFAVVVAARVRLRIRQEAEDAVVLRGPLVPLMATLKRAYECRLIASPTHVGEPGRTQRLGSGLLRAFWGREPTPGEVNRCFPEQRSHSGLVPLYGRRRVVDATWREFRRLAAPGVKLQRANAQTLGSAAKWLSRVNARYKAARLMAMRPILAFAWGEPSDAGLNSLDGYNGGNPDAATRGAIYGNAVSSLDPVESQRAAAIVRREWRDCAFTWIVFDAVSMVTVYTLHFSDTEAEEAHVANAAILRELRASGLPPYRLGVGTQAAPGAGAVIDRLKAALDPLGVIAPGHYESPCADA